MKKVIQKPIKSIFSFVTLYTGEVTNSGSGTCVNSSGSCSNTGSGSCGGPSGTCGSGGGGKLNLAGYIC